MLSQLLVSSPTNSDDGRGAILQALDQCTPRRCVHCNEPFYITLNLFTVIYVILKGLLSAMRIHKLLKKTTFVNFVFTARCTLNEDRSTLSATKM